MPAVPTGTAGPLSAVMHNLRTLGGGDRYGQPDILPPKVLASDVEAHGLKFFADAETRECTESWLQKKREEQAQAGAEGAEAAAADASAPTTPIIQDAEDAIRQVVMDSVVAGKHEKPVVGKDPMGIVRSWALREGSYSTRGMAELEAKVKSLLAKGPKAKAQPRKTT